MRSGYCTDLRHWALPRAAAAARKVGTLHRPFRWRNLGAFLQEDFSNLKKLHKLKILMKQRKIKRILKYV